MSKPSQVAPIPGLPLPSHLDLPFEDGAIVHNFRELPQSLLLTEPLLPVLTAIRPEGDFCIGQDSGIYWRRLPDPPYAQAVAPDWFLVLGVPPLRDGELRRSYVMWDEDESPYVILEFVSDANGRERDRTKNEGKFWIYEHKVQPAFYGIFDVVPGTLEMYHRIEERFRRMEPNAHGRYPISQLQLELGVWVGEYNAEKAPWMRWFAPDGRLIPTGYERAEQESQRVEQERQRAESERDRAEKYAAKLRELGIDLPQ